MHPIYHLLAHIQIQPYYHLVPYTKHKALLIGRTLKGDCDKTLLIVTEDGRKLEATIRKARDSTSKWACVTEPVCEVEVELYMRKHKATIVSLQLLKFFSNIPKTPSSAVSEAMIFEIVNAILPIDVPEDNLYESLRKTYNILNNPSENHLSVLAWFIFGFLFGIGYQLSMENCQVCGEKIEGDSYFDIKKGSAICASCVSRGNIHLPDFARKAISALEYVSPDGLSFDPKLSKGIIELFTRIIQNRFDVTLKTSLHVKTL